MPFCRWSGGNLLSLCLKGAMSIQCQPERLAFSRFYVCEVSRLAVYPQSN